jgi:hypothetical protein
VGAIFQDITGNKYSRLTAIKYIGKDNLSRRVWECACECGNKANVALSALKCGNTKSCGCLKIDSAKNLSTKHGKCGTGAYKSWSHMKSRCLDKNNTHWGRYGGRGIKVCKDWLVFENFYRDMGDRPEGMTLDRKNNEKGYFQDNCRWVSRKTQSNNKNGNIFLVLFEIKKTIAQWAEILEIKPHILEWRKKAGWSDEKVLTKPIGKYKNRLRNHF